MSNYTTDVFSDDAFSDIAMLTAINEVEHVPGRAGELVFATEGVGQGVAVLKVAIEIKGETLELIPTSQRSAPSPVQGRPDKASLIEFSIPQIKLEDTITAASLQNLREFGTANTPVSAAMALSRALQKLARRHDLTLEHHRLGALCGTITDADGSTLVDLFSAFGILNSDGFAAPESFNFDLDSTGTGFLDAIRIKCQAVTRSMHRLAKTTIPPEAMTWAFCGDEFFDKLVSHPSVKEVWDGLGSAEAITRRGGNYAFGAFEVGGIIFENYRGTDDGTTIAIADDECRFFLAGMPGLYAEYFAPADFMETVNTIGLPRYAKAAIDQQFQQFASIHTQQNPLPICLRPRTLMRGTVA